VFQGVEGAGLTDEEADTRAGSVTETLGSGLPDVGPLTTGALDGVAEPVEETMLTELSSVEPVMMLTVKPGSDGRVTPEVATGEACVPLGPSGRPGRADEEPGSSGRAELLMMAVAEAPYGGG
jgi:hypothetical protein